MEQLTLSVVYVIQRPRKQNKRKMKKNYLIFQKNQNENQNYNHLSMAEENETVKQNI